MTFVEINHLNSLVFPEICQQNNLYAVSLFQKASPISKITTIC